MGIHLLINVLVTPVGLNKFKIDKVKDDSDTFRIDRFLTACSTLKEIHWDTVQIYLSLDPSWKHLEPQIHLALLKLFPNAQILGERLESRSAWERATLNYSSDDIVLLQANDDHALVCQDPIYFDSFIQNFLSDNTLLIAGITHFPEMQAMVKGIGSFINGDKRLVGEIHYAIGTQLVRASFFKSWWDLGKIKEETLIFRPDNPFGESVAFSPIEILIPQIELFRHMDGYGHIGMHRPLGPVRNLGVLENFLSPDFELPGWKVAKWPSMVLSLSGRGCDLHQVLSTNDKLEFLRIDVALLQSYWGLKFMPKRTKEIVSINSRSNPVYLFFVATITAFTLPILRNLPDWIFTTALRILQLISKNFFAHELSDSKLIGYLGPWRTILVKYKGRKKYP